MDFQEKLTFRAFSEDFKKIRFLLQASSSNDHVDENDFLVLREPNVVKGEERVCKQNVD